MQDLIYHLYALADGTVKPKCANKGLCHETYRIFPEHLNTVARLFCDWDKFTGSSAYPVPHPHLTCSAAFGALDDLWADNEYGDYRRDLCRFCAQQLEKRLKGESDENKL